MKITVPVMGTRIAPRLCFARDFLIVRAEAGEAQDQQRVSVGQFPMLSAFVDWITQQGIEAVLCCGANRWAITALESKGVEVIWGLTGEAEERIKAYLGGTLTNEIPIRRIRSDGSGEGGDGMGMSGTGPGGRGRGPGAGGGNRGGRGAGGGGGRGGQRGGAGCGQGRGGTGGGGGGRGRGGGEARGGRSSRGTGGQRGSPE